MDSVDYQNQNSGDIFNFNGYNNSSSIKTDFKQNENSSSIIHPPFLKKKQEVLKSMLESNKDSLKLEAMKKLIKKVAKGKSTSDISAKELFPHVVKNVVTKNAELKKLVYLYLLRYAEQEPDLILLSISTFQRSLKDPNPLMRASALRVMSSIRVKIIAPIMYISIKDCANDMSPYVRKTAAHAIPKLYNLEPEMKEDVISIIEKLLQDRTSLVLGSAVSAFEEVCPERFDLIHPNYCKFVSLMADFDEWGQIILINMLIRYGRTQFLNPNIKKFNQVNGNDKEEYEYVELDPDHQLLLKNSKPLLQSRNSAVVLAVIQLYLYLAPHSELNSTIIRPLIRLLHSKPEIQIVVLTNIVSLTKSNFIFEDEDEEKIKEEDDFMLDNELMNKRNILNFEPLLKSFFVKSKDSTQVRILKLKVLTNLSSPQNIYLILKEFQAYINNYQDDMQFVSATIRAIGSCASRIKEIASICLNGLISLLSNRNEAIIAQSIIVIRKQIINKQREFINKQKLNEQNDQVEINEEKNKNDLKSDEIISLVIKQVSKLVVEKIKNPTAKATVIWILSEFCDKNKKAYQLSPDILRLVAKTFINEVEIVKLQTINLAAKVYLTTSYSDTCKDYFNTQDKERIKLLSNYIFNLAKYDLNYDIRDRARFLRQLLNKCNTTIGLKLAKQLLMAPKNIFIENKNAKDDKINENNNPCFIDELSQYRIGTLSHFVGKTINGYEELPDFPIEKPDPSVRKQPEEEKNILQTVDKNELNSNKSNKSDSDDFYSSGSSEDSEDDSSSDSKSSKDIESDKESDDESDDDSNNSDESSSETNDSSTSSSEEETSKNEETKKE